MDGSSAIIITSIIGGSITLSTALIKLVPTKSNGNGKIGINSKDIPISCPAHSGVEAQLKELGRDMGEVKKDLKDVNNKVDSLGRISGEIKGIVTSMEERRRAD